MGKGLWEVLPCLHVLLYRYYLIILGNLLGVNWHYLESVEVFQGILDKHCYHMGARRNFSRGGANLWGGPKKICEGGPPYFFRQALKYAYRGGGGGEGCSFDARRFFFLGDPKSIKVDLQNL